MEAIAAVSNCQPVVGGLRLSKAGQSFAARKSSCAQFGQLPQLPKVHSNRTSPKAELKRHEAEDGGAKKPRQVAARAIAVNPPASPAPPEDDILPPQDDSATGWEGSVIRTERRINVALTGFIVTILDAIYTDRHYARFYMLETIARVPYFAYLSVLHVYESFGWWRRADYLKVHFAESWNELHHLLIMEALGGDKRWLDRFLAQHVAVAYYTVAALMYIVSPRMAYHLNECVEKHAYHTYDKFVKEFGDKLKLKPPPEVAVRYYTGGDLYMFDEFQTAQVPGERRPKIENLYDVFINIRNDEAEHCKTMRACQTAGALISPHQDTPSFLSEPCSGVLECSVTAMSAADRALKHGLHIDDAL